ncbi:hypothetical protein Mcate_01779 [Meiothermus taiwanensis]|uniref:Uncharacterized protein n=1 Tax=Meiothermus taiwanensis TaxID=172827 RepID=A0A399DWI4_9DEIN|nr:hypothetical protein Mcate_01779 [Meiothermus taiwanensis]
MSPLIPDSASLVPKGSELIRSKGYAFFAKPGEGTWLWLAIFLHPV